jgi:hypothetical protein
MVVTRKIHLSQNARWQHYPENKLPHFFLFNQQLTEKKKELKSGTGTAV